MQAVSSIGELFFRDLQSGSISVRGNVHKGSRLRKQINEIDRLSLEDASSGAKTKFEQIDGGDQECPMSFWGNKQYGFAFV